MKDQATRQRFIELRAQDISFDKIGKQINVSKPTLIKWSRQYTKEIAAERKRLDRERERRYKEWVDAELEEYTERIKKVLAGQRNSR